MNVLTFGFNSTIYNEPKCHDWTTRLSSSMNNKWRFWKKDSLCMSRTRISVHDTFRFFTILQSSSDFFKIFTFSLFLFLFLLLRSFFFFYSTTDWICARNRELITSSESVKTPAVFNTDAVLSTTRVQSISFFPISTLNLTVFNHSCASAAV